MGIIQLFRDRAFRSFLGIVRRYKWIYLATIGAQVSLTALALVSAEASRRLFDLAPQIPRTTLTWILITIGVATLLQALMNFLSAWMRSWLNESVVYRMRREILGQLQNLPLSFHEGNHTSNCYTIMYHELETVKNFIVFDVQKFISLPLSFTFVGLYLLSVHPTLGLIALSVGPLQLLSNLVFKERYKQAVGLQNKVTNDVFFTIGETLNGVREVKANQLEDRVEERMREIEVKGVEYNVLLTNLNMARSIVRDAPSQLGYILGIALGAGMMASGQIGPGGLVAFITLLGKVAEPFTSMVEIINTLQRAVAGTRRLSEVMNTPTEEREQGLPLQAPIQSIRFNHLGFHYNPGFEVLKDVDFEIPGGSSIAVVGPSGAGKTTMVKLLYRFYEPQSGGIEINGVPLSQYSIESLRGSMALVSQDVFIFDGTVYENIASGKSETTPEEVHRAAVLAQAWEFIQDLPQGMETHVGERGVKLSQGQKQRVAIARAILRGASILLMDEPTSALDVETEAHFQHHLGEWASGCTKITIAHRLSTIREADYVIFLDGGQIVEQGTPEQLLRTHGRFRSFWEKQSLLDPAI